ncbi:MAG: NAD(P)-binding protein [Clostridiales bacterium]|nr:NAD(P)-binding protein [Clostridiales bacterium]
MSACPFPFDIRDFLDKLRRGRFDAAYRIYRNAVVFPDIVWRLCPVFCKEACVRSAADSTLSMPMLERACIEHARSTLPIAFNVPAKEQRIAIVGAGLAGLTCAMKFVPKKYAVTIYEQGEKIGGSLSRYLPEEIYLRELRKQFGDDTYTLLLQTRVKDLFSLAYDAVYVSSGVDLPGEGEHIFRCPPGLSPVDQILHGLGSLNEIEWYIKTGKRSSPEDDTNSQSRSLPPMIVQPAPAPAVLPANGESYTKQEAQAEAARCIHCDCTACLDNCALLRRYKMFPPRLQDEVNLTMNPVTLLTSRTALREIVSCNQCGLCKQVCPVGVDVGDYLQRTRRELHETNAFPPAFHEFWLRDMAFANGEAQVFVKPSGNGECSAVFFPGCQSGGSDPRYVTEPYARLLDHYPGTALLLRCCGAPALWAGDSELFQAGLAEIRELWQSLGKPDFILSCPYCLRVFREYLPELSCHTVYELFHQQGTAFPSGFRGEASVFDPCASRYFPELQQTVRELAQDMGYALSELPHSKEEARCCSWGGQSFTAAPSLTRALVDSLAAQSENPYLTYCVNCRDILSNAGKDCRHILDLLLGIDRDGQAPPTVTQRRQNRLSLKEALVSLYGSSSVRVQEEKDADAPPLRLRMDDDLGLRMSDALILEEDIRAVIRYCEQSGRKVLDMQTGYFSGYLKQGVVTYWAEYTPVEEDGSYRLIRAYSHRLTIEEGS